MNMIRIGQVSEINQGEMLYTCYLFPYFTWRLCPNPDATHASEIAGTSFSELSSAYAARAKIPGLVRGTFAALGRQNF